MASFKLNHFGQRISTCDFLSRARILIALNRLVSEIITFGNDQISLFQETASVVALRRCCMGRQ
jgi:hypothetical protein